MFNLLASYKAFDVKGIFSNFLSHWYYYAIFAVLVAGLIIFFIFKKEPDKTNLSSTQKIVYSAIISALCAVANIFDLNISSSLQISFVATVGFVAGYILGGAKAFTACFIGDLVGALINPHGPYNPIIAIGTGLWGLIPGIIFSYFKGNRYVKLAISYVISAIIISGLVNTFGIYMMYGLGKRTFGYYFATYPFKLITVFVNFLISFALVKVIDTIRNSIYGKRKIDFSETKTEEKAEEVKEQETA